MDVSFSTNTWKINQIQSIDLKLQQQFYASTPYDLNDFKQTIKPPTPIFKVVQTSSHLQKGYIKKQMMKKDGFSLVIFITYLYEYLYRTVSKIQKKKANPELKNKIPSQPHLKSNKTLPQPETEKQTQRKLFSPEKKQKNEEFEVMKSLKLKIYEIDLCKLKNVPQKFIKYYNNNLLKKIIFQYLSKVLYNISLVQIVLQTNELLCFALSLVSQSLLYRKQKITQYNQNQNFYEEVLCFLQHFEVVEQQNEQPTIKTMNVLPPNLIKKKDRKDKVKSFEQLFNAEKFTHFFLGQRQMKGKHALLKQQQSQNDKKYVMYLQNQQKPAKSDFNQSIKPKQKNFVNSPKKPVGSSRSITTKSQKKIKQEKPDKSWMSYLGCLKYFFSDSPKG